MALTPVQVVIVGAGISGLTAAAKLLHNGVKEVVVLEAQDYVGGRTKAAFISGKPVDLGAQYCHGRKGNPVFEIADKLGRVPFLRGINEIEESLHNPLDFFYTSCGERVPKKEAEELLNVLNQAYESAGVEDASSTTQTINDQHYSVFQDFMAMNSGMSAQKRDFFNAIYRWHSCYIKVDNGVDDLSNLSTWATNCYTVLDGDRFTDFKGGMAGITKVVADLVPPGIIHLNTPVARIEWARTQHEKKVKNVKVICDNGDIFEADHVIVTISIGCMQHTQQQLFQPPLPLSSQQAINHVGFGTIGKVFLQWENPFWTHLMLDSDDFFISFELLWLESQTMTISSDRSLRKTKYGHPWWYGIYCFEAVFDQPDVLEVWLTQDQIEVAEDLEDDEVKAVITDVLRFFLKDIDIPEPSNIVRTRWLGNPFTRGTYSYHSSRLSHEDVLHLGKPLPSPEDPQLLFAGEGYSLDFLSTYHGAFISGNKQADRILGLNGITSHTQIIDLIPGKRS